MPVQRKPNKIMLIDLINTMPEQINVTISKIIHGLVMVKLFKLTTFPLGEVPISR